MTERFELLSQLGEGTMGSVWKARDTVTGDVLAMKLLHQSLASRPDLVQRFEREVEVSRRITSPNVVEVLGFGKRQGVPFLAMEFIDGVSLRDYIRSRGQLSFGEALPIFRQIIQGLAAAHTAEIVHRDVKPTNILINTAGVVKLVDFGVARAQDVTRLTGANQTFGTPFYMSPEGQEDERSDMYSSGCVLYEMLTGHPPFEGRTAHEVVLRHLRDTVDLSQLPADARPLVNWMMQKEASQRPANAMALLPVLNGQASVPAHAVPFVPPVPGVSRPGPSGPQPAPSQFRPAEPATEIAQPPFQPQAQPPFQPQVQQQPPFARPAAQDHTQIASPGHQGPPAGQRPAEPSGTQPYGNAPQRSQPEPTQVYAPQGYQPDPQQRQTQPQGGPAADPFGRGQQPSRPRPDPFAPKGAPKQDPFTPQSSGRADPFGRQEPPRSAPQRSSPPPFGPPPGSPGNAPGLVRSEAPGGHVRIRSGQAATSERNPLFSIFAIGGGVVLLLAFFFVPAFSIEGFDLSVQDYIESANDGAGDEMSLRAVNAWWLIPLAGLASIAVGALGAVSQAGVGRGLARLALIIAVVALLANWLGWLGIRIADGGGDPEPLLLPITGLWEDLPAFPVMTLGAILAAIGAIIGLSSANAPPPPGTQRPYQ